MELLALRDGVRLGTYDNPVVIVPGAAPLIVDAATLDFLLELQRGHRPLIGDDSASQESITLLMNAPKPLTTVPSSTTRIVRWSATTAASVSSSYGLR